MRYALLMYDIEDDRIRTRLFKYLKRQECIPLQKSVWIVPLSWKEGRHIEAWVRKEVIPALSCGDQVHIWPLSRRSLEQMRALKSHTDLSFLLAFRDDILVV